MKKSSSSSTCSSLISLSLVFIGVMFIMSAGLPSAKGKCVTQPPNPIPDQTPSTSNNDLSDQQPLALAKVAADSKETHISSIGSETPGMKKEEATAVEGDANFNKWSKVFGDEPKRSKEDMGTSSELFNRRGFGWQKIKSRENEEL